MKLCEQADKIFNYIIIKNNPHIFNLNSESKSNSADNVNILNSNNNTLITILGGSSDSLGSYGTPGTPPSKPKNIRSNSNLYLTPSSGQSKRLASKVSNIIFNLNNLGPSGTIIVQTAFTNTINIPNVLSSALESAQQSKLLIKYLTHNNLYRGNFKYSSAIYFIYLYSLSVIVTLD